MIGDPSGKSLERNLLDEATLRHNQECIKQQLAKFLDFESDAPNRDGTKGYGGCTYCNNQTFNPGYCTPVKSVRQQLDEGRGFFSRKYPSMKYLAYFQAYTNTYGQVSSLMQMYRDALAVEGVVGIIVGTRPDCMPQPLLDELELLARVRGLLLWRLRCPIREFV